MLVVGPFGDRTHIGISAKDFRLSDIGLATALLPQADNLLISGDYGGNPPDAEEISEPINF
jgi:hypothetical protein